MTLADPNAQIQPEHQVSLIVPIHNEHENLADLVGWKVADCVALHDGKPVTFMPNWRGSLAVFRLQKKINSKRT